MVTLSHDVEATTAAEARARLEDALIRLDPDWSVFRDLEIGTPPDDVAADYLLLHGRLGIALVDMAPGRQRDPVEAFRKFLDSERFTAFFPGFLPIVRLIVGPGETAVEDRLQAAFSSHPPLAISDPEWVEAANSLLVAPDPAELQPPAMPAMPAWPDEPPVPNFADRARREPAYDPAPRPEPDRRRRPIAETPWAEPPEPETRRWLSPTAAVIVALLLGGGGAAAWLLLLAPDSNSPIEPRSATIALTPPPHLDQSLPNAASDATQPPDKAAQAANNSAANPRTLPPPASPELQAAPAPEPATATQPATAPTTDHVDASPSLPAPSSSAKLVTTEPPAAAKAPVPATKPVASATAQKIQNPPHVKPVKAAHGPAPTAAHPPPARSLPAAEAGPPIDAADLPPLDAADLPPPSPAPPPPAAASSPGAVTRPLSLLARPAPAAGSGNTGDATASTQSPPVIQTPAAAPAEAATGSSGTASQVCRIYTATKTVLGKPQLVKGLACRLPDGQWQLVTEAPDQ
jgi:hypothetical protein